MPGPTPLGTRLRHLNAHVGAHPRVALCLALLPFLALAWREWPFQPDLGAGDYAQYLAHAAALIEGRPYTDTGYLYNPAVWGWAPLAYPPGWPLTLAVVGTVFGLDIGIAKAVTLLFACGSLLLAGAYFRREQGLSLGVGVVLVAGLSVDFVTGAVVPLSDLPFAAIVWLTLLVADAPVRWGWKRSAAVTSLAGLAVLFRPHGVVLVAALAAWALFARRRHGNWVLGPPAALLFATVVGRLVMPDDLMRALPSFDTLLQNLRDTGARDLRVVFESHLYPFGVNPLDDAYHAVGLATMLLGLVVFMRSEPRRLVTVFAVAYAAALAVLSYRISPRFGLPLFPLFVFGLLNGIRVLADRARPGAGHGASLSLATLLMIGVVVPRLAADREPRVIDSPAFQALVAHLRTRVASGEEPRVASVRPRILAWETGAPGMVLLLRGEPDTHLGTWCDFGITHVILGPGRIPGGATDAARRAIEAFPTAFELAWENEAFVEYRFDRAVACREARPVGR
jgi:hypothetical protein